MNEVNRLGPNKIEFKATSDKLIKLLEFIKALSQTKESTLTIETQGESENRILKAFWETIELQADQYEKPLVKEDQVFGSIRSCQASGFLSDSVVAALNLESFIQHDLIDPTRENESPKILRQLSQEKVDILLNFFKRNTTLKAEQFQISVQKIKSQVLKDRFKANKSRFPEPKKAFFASTHPSEIFYNAVGERNGFRKFPRVSSFTLSSKSTFFFENNQDYVDPEGYHHLFLVNYYPNPKWETNSRSDWTKVSEDDMILPCFLYRFKVQR
eukprot:TRINITY_DN1247_c0_g3_i5.p1 TRINITY_DN1247_c0_g3~~TRINITY_DN1247_c0_g3_i5.p1  ORF type:complete len:271 (+),score=29.81 TRINITY_DN1247_c0_g3_i5:75-887(+)